MSDPYPDIHADLEADAIEKGWDREPLPPASPAPILSEKMAHLLGVMDEGASIQFVHCLWYVKDDETGEELDEEPSSSAALELRSMGLLDHREDGPWGRSVGFFEINAKGRAALRLHMTKTGDKTS